jgi:hypothetical protein
LQPIKASALIQVPQARHLGIIRRDDQLAADLMRNFMFTAEGDHFLNARDRQLSFDRPRFIVQPTVQHAAVMAGLVLSGFFLLL